MSSDVFLAGQIVGYGVESEPDDDHGAGMPIFKACDEGTSESSDPEDGEAPAHTVSPADAVRHTVSPSILFMVAGL